MLDVAHEVLHLFADRGLCTSRRFEGSEGVCTVELDETDTYLSAVEARGRAANVVGAGRRPRSVGRAVVHHLKRGDYQGRLFAVNPRAGSILGVHSYLSVSALPKTRTWWWSCETLLAAHPDGGWLDRTPAPNSSPATASPSSPELGPRPRTRPWPLPSDCAAAARWS
ncbi:CoA-binding protein [Streptomyces chartreusis]|uniref:CoA-binding protein n=1 Tax=Streptomyces chartreusis TaxID=1969 RepID=UPI0037FB8566